MSTAEFKRLRGEPDVILKATMGEETGQPWEGLIYRYFSVRDTIYKTLLAKKCDTFIFQIKGDEAQLATWTTYH